MLGECGLEGLHVLYAFASKYLITSQRLNKCRTTGEWGF